MSTSPSMNYSDPHTASEDVAASLRRILSIPPRSFQEHKDLARGCKEYLKKVIGREYRKADEDRAHMLISDLLRIISKEAKISEQLSLEAYVVLSSGLELEHGVQPLQNDLKRCEKPTVPERIRYACACMKIARESDAPWGSIIQSTHQRIGNFCEHIDKKLPRSAFIFIHQNLNKITHYSVDMLDIFVTLVMEAQTTEAKQLLSLTGKVHESFTSSQHVYEAVLVERQTRIPTPQMPVLIPHRQNIRVPRKLVGKEIPETSITNKRKHAGKGIPGTSIMNKRTVLRRNQRKARLAKVDIPSKAPRASGLAPEIVIPHSGQEASSECRALQQKLADTSQLAVKPLPPLSFDAPAPPSFALEELDMQSMPPLERFANDSADIFPSQGSRTTFMPPLEDYASNSADIFLYQQRTPNFPSQGSETTFMPPLEYFARANSFPYYINQ